MEHEFDTSSLDLSRPNAARMYDYYLGGSANFAIDRDAVDRATQVVPDTVFYLRNNRAFLIRAVRYLMTEAGINQFLDLGSGIPTKGNVHEIAQEYDSTARVAYVDFESIAVHHARNLLGDDTPWVTMSQADIREPEAVLAAPGVADLLDFNRPIAVLAVGILPFVLDDAEAVALMARYRDATVPGSYAAISHISALSFTQEEMDADMEILAETSTPEKARTKEEIAALLPGYRLVEPGIVPATQWHPEQEPTEDEVLRSNNYVAVGALE